jgi:hypothetical protein
MTSTSFFNKLGIILYSILTSILSGVNRLIGQEQPISQSIDHSDSQVDLDTGVLKEHVTERSVLNNRESLKQAFLSLLLWIILGLATGFLIGMIRGG